MAKKGAKKRASARAPEAGTLRWLKLHQFRHVEPCELRFSETYNVLLGLNGTGKTTLLELISAALTFNFSKMKKEAFFIEYEMGVGGGSILVSVRNEEVRPDRPGEDRGGDIALAGRLLRSEPFYRPSVDLVISDAAGERQLSIRVDESGTEFKIGQKTTKRDVLRARSLYGSDFLFLLLTSMPGDVWDKRTAGRNALENIVSAFHCWNMIRRFDESLRFLGVVTGSSTNISVQKWTNGTLSNLAVARGPVPVSILEEITRQSGDWGSSAEPVITVTQEHVELLSRIAKMLGFAKVELRLTHLKTEVTGSLEVMSFGDLRFMLQRSDGSVVPHKLLSYGQKRALAFLYYLAMNERAVIADELVDGLHHLWIVECLEAIGDRQAFLASQNPLLLDYLEFDSADKVRASFVQCRLKTDKNGERMTWSNMSEYDADRFFDAYQVGLQHVSEILRTKGLW